MEPSLDNFFLLGWLVLGIFYFIHIFHKDIVMAAILYSIGDVLQIDKKQIQIESSGLFVTRVMIQNTRVEFALSQITLFPNINLVIINQNAQKVVCRINVLEVGKIAEIIRKALKQIGVLKG